jgi:formate hydrogenlyase subunit 3/multisubunit Na+/H+ antiporter MnhD subunit
MMRIIFLLFNTPDVLHFLLIMGLITLLIAEMSAMKQQQIKRMLAFSSIGQMGLVIIAFSIGTSESVSAAFFQMFNHAVIKSLLFFAAGYLVFHSGSKNLKDLEGLGYDKPITSFFFALGALAIMGLPPFSGFWSKLYVLISIAHGGHLVILALILVGSVIEAVYYLRVIAKLYTRKAVPENVRRTPVSGLIAMGVLAAVILAVGIYPSLVTKWLAPAANNLIDAGSYIASGLIQ